MVTITNYEKRQGTDGEFFLLQLQGDIEVVFSQATGLPYATLRKTKLPTTFDEFTCQAMIGKQLPGRVIKTQAEEPYEFTIPQTGEVITLDYRYVYSPKEIVNTMEKEVFETPILA